jgi:hypothetical protein
MMNDEVMSSSAQSSVPPLLPLQPKREQKKKEKPFRIKRQDRKVRQLEELDPMLRNRFIECYEIYQAKETQNTETKKLKISLDAKLRSLAERLQGIDVILPGGKGKFRFNPAKHQQQQPATDEKTLNVMGNSPPVFQTANRAMIANALYQFCRQNIYKDSETNAEHFVKGYINFLTAYVRDLKENNNATKKPKSNKVPTHTFTIVIPRPRKRKSDQDGGPGQGSDKRRARMKD